MKNLLFAIVDTYQNNMEANYQEKSMLTNLFVENKFWGWMGLTIIVISPNIFLEFLPKRLISPIIIR